MYLCTYTTPKVLLIGPTDKLQCLSLFYEHPVVAANVYRGQISDRTRPE